MVELAPSGTEAKRDDFAAVLLLELQPLFESVSIGLVDFEIEVVLLNPAPAIVDTQLRVARGHLLNSHDDLHER